MDLLKSLFPECSICLEKIYFPFSIRCSHTFHESCIERWMNINNSCPMCRKEIMTLEDEKNVMTILILLGMDI